MRAFQFWILLLGSSLVSILLIKLIFLNRTLAQQERTLADSQQTVSAGTAYESAWRQLALRLYQAGQQDPALDGILKEEKIVVHAKNGTTPAAPASAAPAPQTSSKTPAAAPASTPSP